MCNWLSYCIIPARNGKEGFEFLSEPNMKHHELIYAAHNIAPRDICYEAEWRGESNINTNLSIRFPPGTPAFKQEQVFNANKHMFKERYDAFKYFFLTTPDVLTSSYVDTNDFYFPASYLMRLTNETDTAIKIDAYLIGKVFRGYMQNLSFDKALELIAHPQFEIDPVTLECGNNNIIGAINSTLPKLRENSKTYESDMDSIQKIMNTILDRVPFTEAMMIKLINSSSWFGKWNAIIANALIYKGVTSQDVMLEMCLNLIKSYKNHPLAETILKTIDIDKSSSAYNLLKKESWIYNFAFIAKANVRSKFPLGRDFTRELKKIKTLENVKRTEFLFDVADDELKEYFIAHSEPVMAVAISRNFSSLIVLMENGGHICRSSLQAIVDKDNNKIAKLLITAIDNNSIRVKNGKFATVQ
jgi:hypothetical protein